MRLRPLARHSRHPRFTTREGGVPAAELQPIFGEWFPHIVEHRLAGGGLTQEFDGVVAFDMTIEAAGFDRIAAQQARSLPDRLKLDFASAPNPRLVDPSLAPLVRAVPARTSDRCCQAACRAVSSCATAASVLPSMGRVPRRWCCSIATPN